MSPPKRNAPCSCGSGKKYKYCCGRATITTPAATYDRLRRLDGEASNQILLRAKRLFGEEGLASAMAAFRPGREKELNENDPDFEFFFRWFQYDWVPEHGEQPPEALLRERDERIDPDVFRLIDKTLDAPYSFLQVTDRRPGEMFFARDIFRDREFQIIERTASKTIEPGSIIYARVVEMDGTCFMMGNGPQVIPAEFMADLVDLREQLLEEQGSASPAMTDDVLSTYEEDMRLTYFDLIEAATRRLQDIRNTDGDPLLFHTIHYEVPSFERAFEALRVLEPKASDTDSLSRDAGEKAPAEKTATIHWSKQRKGREKGEEVLQAVLKIRGTSMIAEVNSSKRAARVKKEIGKLLGSDAVYLRTEIVSPEGAMKKSGQQSGSKDAAKRTEEHARLMAMPEVQAMLKREMEKHWTAWPDTPVPALRGMTPKEAAKDPKGRELLESLLLEFETRNAHMPETFNRVDVNKLRKELGMD